MRRRLRILFLRTIRRRLRIWGEVMENLCGALVERGRVMRMDGDGKCIVASIDRPGIVTLPIAPPAGSVIEEGSTVIFCEFADGQGAIFMVIS